MQTTKVNDSTKISSSTVTYGIIKKVVLFNARAEVKTLYIVASSTD